MNDVAKQPLNVGLDLLWAHDDVYHAKVSVTVLDSCYAAGDLHLGLPPGKVEEAHMEYLTFDFTHRGGPCGHIVHKIEKTLDIKFSSTKPKVTAFAVVNGEVVGQDTKLFPKQASSTEASQRVETSETSAEQPNHFELHGKNKKIKIIYDSTSITGKRQFTYEENGVPQHFEDEEIWDEATVIGRLVSVLVNKRNTLTIFIPKLLGNTTEFSTLAVFTTWAGGYRLDDELQGTAKLVRYMSSMTA